MHVQCKETQRTSLSSVVDGVSLVDMALSGLCPAPTRSRGDFMCSIVHRQSTHGSSASLSTATSVSSSVALNRHGAVGAVRAPAWLVAARHRHMASQHGHSGCTRRVSDGCTIVWWFWWRWRCWPPFPVPSVGFWEARCVGSRRGVYGKGLAERSSEENTQHATHTCTHKHTRTHKGTMPTRPHLAFCSSLQPKGLHTKATCRVLLTVNVHPCHCEHGRRRDQMAKSEASHANGCRRYNHTLD